MYDTLEEYEERESKESKLVKDADTLEWLLALKEQFDTGNTRAKEWMKIGITRLKTDHGKELATAIMETNSNDWWFLEGSVIRKKKYL